MKKFTNIFLIFLLGVTSVEAGGFAGGSGTKQDPFQVATAHDLNEVRNHPDKYFIQVADISLNVVPFNMGNYWTPIGGNRYSDELTDNFTGHYNGQGYVISNLVVVQPGQANVGLFGHVGSVDGVTTTIKNVNLYNVLIIGGKATGALVGRVTGNQNTRIENCSVKLGSVRGDASTGGLIGANNSFMITSVAAEGYRPVVYKCSAEVSVSVRSYFSEDKSKFGALVGCNEKGMISHSYAKGEVVANDSTASFIGGLTGSAGLRGIIINSYSTAVVNAEGANFVGGLIGNIGTGRNKGIVYSSYWSRDHNSQDMISAGGEGLSHSALQDPASFTNWDFFNVWQLNPKLNGGFPYFAEKLTEKSKKIWTGLVSSSWNEPSNWSPHEVPSTTDRVTIPSGTSHSPIVEASVMVTDLLVEDDALLTLQDTGSSLTLTGTLSGSQETIGSASIRGAGILVLAGSSLQSIPAMTIDNMVVNNANNVQLAGSITVNGTLTMKQGLLDLRGFEITLGTQADLSETENDNISSRVYGSSGLIRTHRLLDNPSGEIAGMGVEIISASNMGHTLIERGHSALNEGDESKSILRWFNIEPANNKDLDATLVFHYFISELNIYGENDNFSLFRRRHGDTEWVWIPSELDAAHRVLTANHVDEFSTWTAGSTDKPLPIVLLSWEARPVDNTVELNWITAAEINNNYFTVERSSNGIDFETISTLAGAGTSSRTNYYKTIDDSPVTGLVYYRLKQTDYNGEFEYSKIVSIYQKAYDQDIVIYPNPSTGVFSVAIGGEQTIQYKIFDMQGRLVVSSNTQPGQITLVYLPQLQKGIYSMVFYTHDVQSKKIQIL